MKENLKLIPEVFFDFFAYFIPGCFLLIFLLLDKNPATHRIFKDIGNFREILLIVFGGYIFGHILTTLSTLIIVKPVDYLFGNPLHTLIGMEDGQIGKFRAKLSDNLISEISSVVQKKFKSKIDKHTFFLCENYIRANHPDIGFLIRKRHAFEHLCRNVVVSSLILLLTLRCSVFDVLLVSMGVVSLIRYFDYRISWPKVVYESFFLLTLEA